MASPGKVNSVPWFSAGGVEFAGTLIKDFDPPTER
jgi:hypothetical protein